MIKISIRIVLILMIIFLNWLFISLFISSNEYEDLVYKNGGYFYSVLTLVLIAMLGAFKRKSTIKDLEKIPKEKEVYISNSEQWRILIYSTLKASYLYMTFGLFEIGLFFAIRSLASREVGELLFFGFWFLFFSPLIQIARFHILKSKQGYPKFSMNYVISNDQIVIKTDGADKIIDFGDVELTEIYNDMIYVKTKIAPENLIFRISNK